MKTKIVKFPVIQILNFTGNSLASESVFNDPVSYCHIVTTHELLGLMGCIAMRVNHRRQPFNPSVSLLRIRANIQTQLRSDECYREKYKSVSKLTQMAKIFSDISK